MKLINPSDVVHSNKRAHQVNKRQQLLKPNRENENFRYYGITRGLVMDTADPQQMGRLRVQCASLGDVQSGHIEDLPWATYCTPFGGINYLAKGPDNMSPTSATAYGMWAIPKKGSIVTVFCFDGDPTQRGWFASVYNFQTTSSMPHGAVTTSGTGPSPSIREGTNLAIQPLVDNMTAAFVGNNVPGGVNFEYQTRGIDRNVSTVNSSVLGSNPSIITQSDNDIAKYGYKTGYQPNRITGSSPTPAGVNASSQLDSQVYSIVTPGFHAISMDDSVDNCHVRIRTTSGNQIILDDTNERIYINVAGGNAWLEIDKCGNIDVFAAGNLSYNASNDINFTAGGTFRASAAGGFHFNSGKDFRSTVAGDMSANVTGNIRYQTDASLYLESSSDTNIDSGGQLNASSSSDFNINSSSNLNLQSAQSTNINSGATLNLQSVAIANINAQGLLNLQGVSINILAEGSLLLTAPDLEINGSPAGPAGSAGDAATAAPASPQPAFFPSRIPLHEPWPRTMTSGDTTTDPMFPYNDPNVGRVDRTVNGNITIVRGPHWRR